ncbi:unnamed protein product [Phaedon cochleariae]|uniref:Cyclic nucleotide-binding domain-containing protein n=1 Tax=Phaedon cochleariae TaxID=80249 RepID=A0A9P0GUS6_PHACE|nr:unnamed protein product [Phaedon cochleariae]
MSKHEQLMKHTCRIKESQKNTGLPPLQPNASYWQKCIRFIRKLSILNITIAQNRDFFRNTSTMRQEMRRHNMGPHFYMIHPFSVINLLLDAAFIIVMMIRVYLLAFHIKRFQTNLDTGADVMWTMLMISHFLRGYTDSHTKTIYVEPKKVIIHRLRTYFLFDVAILASHLIIFRTNNVNVVVTIYSIMFISYLVRFKSFLSVLENLVNFMKLKKAFFAIYHLTLIVGIMHLLTCLVLTNPSMIIMIDAYQSKPVGEFTMWDWYIGGFSIVVYHFLGAFFVPTDQWTDDQNPITNFYLFLILLVGRICTLILLAKVLEYFGYTKMSSSVYELKMQQLMSFIRFKELPPHLRERVILHFRSKFNGEYFNERRIVGSMSESLRADLFLYGARKLIQRHEALKNLPPHALGTLVAQMDYQLYLTGDVIIDNGYLINHVYFIASGTIAGYNSVQEEILHLEEGGEFGLTSWLIYKTNITVLRWVAVETSEVYTITRDALGVFFDAQPEVAKYFEARMRERVGKFEKHRGGMWSRGERTLLRDLKEGVLLKPPRLRIFGFE